jgi:prolipoprotein diacylglyceryltransferase
MLTVNLGPFAVPISQLVLMIALLAALGAGHLVGRRQQTGGIGHSLSDMLLVALLVARIAFVAIWFDTYRNSPWSILDIRDGGFTPWAGMVAALLVAIWHGRSWGWQQGRLSGAGCLARYACWKGRFCLRCR